VLYRQLKPAYGRGPEPHYEAHFAIQGLLICVEENGRRTVGRFINRRFQPVKFRKKAVVKHR